DPWAPRDRRAGTDVAHEPAPGQQARGEARELEPLGDGPRRAHLGARELGVGVQVPADLDELVGERGDEGADAGRVGLEVGLASRLGHGHDLTPHTRSSRPRARTASTTSLTCWARSRVVTSNASGVCTTTTPSTPTTATRRSAPSTSGCAASTATTSVEGGEASSPVGNA